MLSDERTTKSLRLCMSKLRYLVFMHRIRTVAAECVPKEQAALLTTACVNSSRIQRLVANTAASMGGCVDGPDVVVDAILCAEHARLEIWDVKVAARRFHDLASVARRKTLIQRIAFQVTLSKYSGVRTTCFDT